MHVDTPASGVVGEVRDHHLWWLEGAVAVIERDPDPGVSKADDVRAAVAREIGEETRVLINPPAPSVIAEIRNHKLWRLEGAIAVVERDPDPRASEADDVRAAVASEVGQEAWVLFDTPASGAVTEVPDDQLGCLESAVARTWELNASHLGRSSVRDSGPRKRGSADVDVL